MKRALKNNIGVTIALILIISYSLFRDWHDTVFGYLAAVAAIIFLVYVFVNLGISIWIDIKKRIKGSSK